MDVSSLPSTPHRPRPTDPPAAARKLRASQSQSGEKTSGAEPDHELREAFRDFVGQTLFGSLLASMRKTVGKPAYMHGGRTEEVFQKQLDGHIVENLTEASADTLADPMYELFNMQRR